MEGISLIKKILYAVLVIVFLLVSGLLVLDISLDSIIKEAVEKNISRVIGSSVTVETVNCSVISGNGSVVGIRVLNPEGFSEGPALILGKVYFKVDMGSLSMDLITLSEIRADSFLIVPEKNGEGKLNFQVLSQNLKKTNDRKDQEEKTSKIRMPKFRISEFVLSEGEIDLSGLGYDSGNLRIPEYRLQNLGGTDGVTPAEVMEEIFSGLFHKIILNTFQSGIKKWFEKIL